jgi:uncharacterized protein
MSTPPDRPLDALGLAQSGARVARDFAIAGFARLRDRLAQPIGSARASVEFGMGGQWPIAQLAVDAEVMLTCQRCLQPMRWRLASESALVFAEAVEPGLPDGYEAVGGDPHRLDLGALVEDELLLALPIIPQHAEGEACQLPGGVAAAGEGKGGGMRRPFAGLKDLLNH